MCSGIAEPQWWRGRLSFQRILPRKQRRTNLPQVILVLFFIVKSRGVVWFFGWFLPFPDSSSSDSSSDSDSDSSSSSSSSDDEDEKKEEKKKKKKKEWHSKLVPVHKHLPLFPSLSVVTNYLTRPCKINVSEWGLWASVQWPRLQTRTYLLWSR